MIDNQSGERKVNKIIININGVAMEEFEDSISLT